MQDENKFYEQVAKEIQKGHVLPTLWAKSIAKANGNDPLAKSLYIQWRVEQLQAEQAQSASAAYSKGTVCLPSSISGKVRSYSQIQQRKPATKPGRFIAEMV